MSSIVPQLLKCQACGRWWSNAPMLVGVNPYTSDCVCPCGGDLAPADMAAHNAALPRSADDPSEVQKFAQQKAADAAKKKAAADEKAAAATPPPTAP